MAIEKSFFEVFRKSDKTAWQKVAASEINENNPFEALQWQTQDNLSFAPYYDKTDVSQIKYLEKFILPDESTEYSEPRNWCAIAPVAVDNAGEANSLALDQLANEAEGIIFLLRSSDVDFNTLLKNIKWPHCTVSFIVPEEFKPTAFDNYISDYYENSLLTGALFWSNPAMAIKLSSTIKGFKKFGIVIKPSSPVNEIVDSLTQAVQLIYRLQDSALTAETIIQHIAFSIPVGNNFLIELCKLKVLRMLWYQVTQAFKVSAYQPENLYLHTRSEVYLNEGYQPHANMLHSAVATMISVAGGCNAHTVNAENETEKMMGRIALNNSFILRDEAHFGKVSDPLAGSYAIENIINELAYAAWEKFKNRI